MSDRERSGEDLRAWFDELATEDKSGDEWPPVKITSLDSTHIPSDRIETLVSTEPIPFRRPRPTSTGHTCICGATWRPGFSSDPAWLFTADPRFRILAGVLDCQACGRWKLDVLREQAEAKRAATPPAIPPRERQPAPVIPFHRPGNPNQIRTEGDQP